MHLRQGPRAAPLGTPWIALAALSAIAQAQTAKLNGPLAQPTSGDVIDYLVSPDGSRVVFRADWATDGVFELFSAPADGSAPAVRLNDPLIPGGNVGGTGINIFGAGGGWDYGVASSGRVVFLVDQNTNDVDELYSVPLDGSASPVRLNGMLAAGGDVLGFWISPDGQSVVYRAQELYSGNLFRVPIDGSAPAILLSPNLVTNSVWISPDGSTAAFTVPVSFATREELYTVATDGSAAPILLGMTPLPMDFGYTFVDDLRFSNDGTHLACQVVYDEDGFEGAELYAAPSDASHAPWHLNQQLLGGYVRPWAFDGVERVVFQEGLELVSSKIDGTQRVLLDPAGWAPDEDIRISADRTRVVFAAGNGGQRALFSAPIDGSAAAVQLSTGSSAYIGIVEIVGSTVVYSTYLASWKLFAVPLLGGTSVLLNPAPFDGGSGGLSVHPGGQDVVFLSEGGLAGVVQLFTVPIDASSLPRQLNAPLIPAGDVDHFTPAPDGQHVVYRADQDNNETFELFGAPFAGGPVVTYSPPLVSGPVLGDVLAFVVSADGQRALYRADQSRDEVFGLYAARTDARGEPLCLNASLPDDQSVLPGFALEPGGKRAVFLQADSPGSAAGSLYSASTTQATAPILLEGPSGMYSQDLVIDPQGTRVLYVKQRSLFGGFDLRSARLDGSQPARTLNVPSGSVAEFQLAPDGGLAVYLADQDVTGVMELYRVPADGSAAATKLSAPLPGNADVTAFGFAADSLHVVYLADADVDQQFELYGRPSDGSSPAVKLNDALVAGGDVVDFAVTPDGAHVVYRADQTTDQTFELFRAPIAAGPVVLLTPLPAGRSVQPDYVVTADSQQVLFRANPLGTAIQELFRVPADGSASPVRISGTLVAGGSVDAFALAPDQLRFVYLADQRVDNVKELYAAPLAGGPEVLLHAMPAAADVSTFQVAPDSGLVHYRADPNLNDVFELFAVPLDGSAPPERLNPPLPVGGDVQTDFAAQAGGRAVYRADQEEDNVLELFTGFLGRRTREAATPTRMVVR